MMKGKILIAGILLLSVLFASCSIFGDIEDLRDKVAGKDKKPLSGNDYEAPEPGSSPDFPVKYQIPDSLNLGGDMTSPNSVWVQLLKIIDADGKYVELDLSKCINLPNVSSIPVFEPYYGENIGQDKIVSLILPEEAIMVMPGSVYTIISMMYYTNLKNVVGPNIQQIGGLTFASLDKLTSVDFPKVTQIHSSAFAGCTSLTNVSFPQITNIGARAFEDCTALKYIRLNPSTIISSNNPFVGCTSLKTFDILLGGSPSGLHLLPTNAGVLLNNDELVAYPTASGNISVSMAYGITKIGESAFAGCKDLTSINIGNVTKVFAYSFEKCEKLTSVYMPFVELINEGVFRMTGTATLTITLGSTVPDVGIRIFDFCSEPKNVIVKRPNGATGYGSSPTNTTANNWGNAFRGKGWDSVYGYNSGTVNEKITLTIEDI